MGAAEGIEKVCDAPDIWRVRIPFRNLGSGESNCYILSHGGEWLIVDTGAYSLAGRATLVGALCALGVDFSACRVFLTHMHFDHAEMARFVLPARMRIHAAQSGVAARMPSAQKASRRSLVRLMTAMGASPEDAFGYAICDAETAFLDSALFDLRFVAHDDEVNVGGMAFRVIATPGHTFDHLCLYQPDTGILFGGDMACFAVTPSIDMARSGEDTFAVFDESLLRIRALGASLTLPGHGDAVRGSIGGLIEQTRAKKRRKLELVFEAVRACGLGTGDDVASVFAGDGRREWLSRRVISRYYVMLETIVMLRHLEEEGRVEREFDAYGGVYRYCAPRQ